MVNRRIGGLRKTRSLKLWSPNDISIFLHGKKRCVDAHIW